MIIMKLTMGACVSFFSEAEKNCRKLDLVNTVDEP